MKREHASAAARVRAAPSVGPRCGCPRVGADPIPGAEPGTEAALLQVYEDVLSPALLQALADEAPHLASFAKTLGNLKNSKYTTLWKPTGRARRHRALHQSTRSMSCLTFSSAMVSSPPTAANPMAVVEPLLTALA